MNIKLLPLFAIVILSTIITFGQQNNNKTSHQKKELSSLKPNAPFEYFIFLDNVKKREDVLFLESLISKKPGITFFMAERFPVRCFVMRSNAEIKESIFAGWVGTQYPVISYGTGSIGKEKAYLTYKKNRKSNN